jgi:hypothetical protein
MLTLIKRFFHRLAGIKKYSKALTAAIADHEITETEKRELEAIVTEHGLRRSDLVKAHQKAFTDIFETVLSDQRITEAEKGQLEQLATYFATPLKELGFDQDRFNRGWFLNGIETGKLAEMTNAPPEVRIAENDKLRYLCVANACRRKRITTRVNYTGLSTSIKILPGVRYRIGSIAVAPVTHESIVAEDAGFFWITDQEVCYKGARKHFEIPIKKLAYCEMSDGVMALFKQGRETPFLIRMFDYEIPLGIISVLLN